MQSFACFLGGFPLKLDFADGTSRVFLPVPNKKVCLISNTWGKIILSHRDLEAAEVGCARGSTWPPLGHEARVEGRGRGSPRPSRRWDLLALPVLGQDPSPSPSPPRPPLPPLQHTQSCDLDYLHFHMEGDVSQLNAWPVILFPTLRRAGAEPAGDINYSAHLTLCAHA